MSTIAAFLALGGTSFALLRLPANSVGSPQVINGSLHAVDLAPDAKGERGPRGPQGPNGPAGLQGSAGPQGPQGPADVIVRRRAGAAYFDFPATSSVDVETMTLPAGKWLVRADTQLTYFPNSSPNSDTFHCGIVVDGTMQSQKQGFLGNQTGGTHELPISIGWAIYSTGSSTVVLRCWHDSSLPTGASVPSASDSMLSAIQTGNLDYQNVTG